MIYLDYKFLIMKVVYNFFFIFLCIIHKNLLKMVLNNNKKYNFRFVWKNDRLLGKDTSTNSKTVAPLID